MKFDNRIFAPNNSIMNYELTEEGQWIVLAIKGRIDCANHAQLEAEVSEAINKKLPHFAVNMSLAHFLSLKTIKFLTALSEKLMSENRQFALVETSEKFKRQLDIYGSLECMQVFRSATDWEAFAESQSRSEGPQREASSQQVQFQI